MLNNKLLLAIFVSLFLFIIFDYSFKVLEIIIPTSVVLLSVCIVSQDNKRKMKESILLEIDSFLCKYVRNKNYFKAFNKIPSDAEKSIKLESLMDLDVLIFNIKNHIEIDLRLIKELRLYMHEFLCLNTSKKLQTPLFCFVFEANEINKLFQKAWLGHENEKYNREPLNIDIQMFNNSINNKISDIEKVMQSKKEVRKIFNDNSSLREEILFNNHMSYLDDATQYNSLLYGSDISGYNELYIEIHANLLTKINEAYIFSILFILYEIKKSITNSLNN